MRHVTKINTIITAICVLLMMVTNTASSSSYIIEVVDELSSPVYAGRLTGTFGNDQVAHYIASQFAHLGLEPLPGLENYSQEYPQPARLLTSPPELTIVADPAIRGEPLQSFKDFLVAVGPGLTKEGVVEGQGVILHRVEQLRAEITAIFGQRNSILLIPEHVFVPNQNVIMQHLMTTPRKPVGMIIEADLGDQFFPAPLCVSPAEGETSAHLPLLFSARAEVFQELVEAVEGGSELRMAAHYELTGIKANNVLGVMPGNLEDGPESERQYVIIGAHFDGAGSNLAGLFNPSAHDNASGVAVLLECAARLQRENISLGPTVIFVAFNGEEQGMYGSRYLATNLPYPKDATKMINIDSVGAKTGEYLLIETCSGVESSMQSALLAHSHELGITARAGQSNGSDHRSFADEGIMAINLIQPDFSVMHRPTDTVDVLSHDKLEQVVTLILAYLRQL
ncbi:MAG: M28 family peptidase [Limnochordia bacterium]|nr:M28 family peptidase [Limnochordia bacterium]